MRLVLFDIQGLGNGSVLSSLTLLFVINVVVKVDVAFVNLNHHFLLVLQEHLPDKLFLNAFDLYFNR
jgi:hypothetical protein